MTQAESPNVNVPEVIEQKKTIEQNEIVSKTNQLLTLSQQRNKLVDQLRGNTLPEGSKERRSTELKIQDLMKQIATLKEEMGVPSEAQTANTFNIAGNAITVEPNPNYVPDPTDANSARYFAQQIATINNAEWNRNKVTITAESNVSQQISALSDTLPRDLLLKAVGSFVGKSKEPGNIVITSISETQGSFTFNGKPYTVNFDTQQNASTAEQEETPVATTENQEVEQVASAEPTEADMPVDEVDEVESQNA